MKVPISIERDAHQVADIEHRQSIYGGCLRADPDWRWSWHRAVIVTREGLYPVYAHGVGEFRGEFRSRAGFFTPPRVDWSED